LVAIHEQHLIGARGDKIFYCGNILVAQTIEPLLLCKELNPQKS
jgi:hypothetical protein